MPELTLDVSMLAFQSADTSHESLEALLRTDFPGLRTVTVREQGGDRREYLRLLATAGEARSSIEVTVTRGPNVGYTGGHNLAFAATSSDLFAVVNADATVEPGLFAAAAQAFRDPDVGSVQPLLVRPEPGLGGQTLVDTAGLQWHRSHHVDNRLAGTVVPGRMEDGDIWGADGAVAVYRRRALLDVAGPEGPWDPTFGSYKEDVDLAWRLRRRGWRCRFVPAARAVHVRGNRGDEGLTPRERIARRRDHPGEAHLNGFVNQRVAQVKNEDLTSLARDLGPVLSTEVGAWVAYLAAGGDPREVARRLAARLPAALEHRRRWRQRPRSRAASA